MTQQRPYPATSVPLELYRRGVELGLLPRRVELREHPLNWHYSRSGYTVYRFAAALLAVADLTNEQRETLERSELGFARWCESSPIQAAEAYARVFPYLSPRSQEEVLRRSAGLLKRVEQLIAGRAFGSRRYTYLRHRELFRVLAPGDYPAWLAGQQERLVDRKLWGGTPAEFRENLAHVHVLGDRRVEGLAAALAGISLVEDGFVTEDRELGMGGAYAYTAAQVEAADRQARAAAFEALAPLLPDELHARAANLATAWQVAVPTTPGTRVWSRVEEWHYSQAEAPIPWLTVSERAPPFAALAPDVRRQSVARLVADCLSGEELPGQRRERSRPDTPEHPRKDPLLHEDLPLAAPYLDAGQVSSLLALWGLPEEAVP